MGTPMLDAALKPNTLLGSIFEYSGIMCNDSFQGTIERKHKILRELARRNPDKNYLELYDAITNRRALLFGIGESSVQLPIEIKKFENETHVHHRDDFML